MKVGIAAKRTEVFAASSVISSCVEFYYFSMSRRFQLFFFNHFDQFSRVVLDWQLSISPTCSSLLGYTIHSLTIYSHACSTPPQLRLQLHSCQSKDCKFGKESELRSFVVCAAAAAASWRFSLRSSRPKIFSVRTTAVRFTVVHYFLFPIQCILVFY